MTRHLWRLATPALAPVLLAQGRRVRRVTPRLPEAAGPRTGIVHPSPDGRGLPSTEAVDGWVGRASGVEAGRPPLRLLVAGDSSAAGVGVDTQDVALAGRLAAALARDLGRPVAWTLVARNGARLADVAAMLRQVPAAPFDVAVVAVGVNDATGGTRPAAWTTGWDALRALLDERFGAPVLHASALPPMHRFPALPWPLSGWLGARARRLDAALARWADAREDAHHHAVEFGDDPALMASDGFHPGAAGCRVWADALSRAIVDVLNDTRKLETT